jgi:hypothetical protein
MTDLSSMLVPLETLPGWPRVDNPSPLASLGLLIGLPLVVIVIAFAVAKIGNTVQASRGTANTDTEPVWVGGPTRPNIEGPRRDQAAIEAEQAASLPGSSVATDADAESGQDVGGAGARW